MELINLTVLAPISIGELIDKITILEIKKERIVNPIKQSNVAAELKLLQDIESDLDIPDISLLKQYLRNVNSQLWDIEEAKRACERDQKFDDDFIHHARMVYLKNDERASIKKQINVLCGSTVIEEKSYDSCEL